MNTGTLAQRQSLPLDMKINMSKRRILDFYNHFDGDVYISFSGGKDSTVLLDIVKNVCGLRDVPAVFVNTGLEYPEVHKFALSKADVVLQPKITFKQVIEKYGYPVVSKEQAQYIYDIRNTKSEKLRSLRLYGRGEKHSYKLSEKWKYLLDAPFKISSKCCDIMKKNPAKKYEKDTGRVPILGTMACESNLRKQAYLRHGCNAFDAVRPNSTPLGFWTEQDILQYLYEYNIEYAPIYGNIIYNGGGTL